MNIKAAHQGVDRLTGVVVGFGGQMGVSRGGQDADMAQDFLQFEKINSCFQQMSGETVPQGMA